MDETAIGAPDLRGYNVIMIVMDALRADHLGAYGYFRDTSPFMDSLADQGLVFEKATSPSSYTLQAMASVFSGQLPSRIGAVEWTAQPPESTTVLAERFKAAGYFTGFVSPEAVLGTAAFKRGIDEVRQDPGLHDRGLNQRLVERAISLADESGSQPFFTYLHFFNPHNPYTPAPEDYLEFAESVLPDPLTSEAAVTRGVGELTLRGYGPGNPRFNDLVIRYDGEIHALDQAVAALFEGLKQRGKLDKTLILITADHGDEFLEHGYLDHAFTLYEEVTHVPLILWAPGAIKPGRVTRRVGSIDIAPTLSAAMGLPTEGPFDGENLYAATRRPIISELLMKDRAVSRSIIVNEWKYIASVRWKNIQDRKPGHTLPWDLAFNRNGFGMNYWTPLMKEELYHLESDPREQRNLAASNKDKLLELRYLLSDSFTDAQDAAHNPLAEEESKNVVGNLRALGYLQASSDDGEASGGEAFRVPEYQLGQVVDFGSAKADLFLPYGWSVPEGTHRWTDGEEALLGFDYPGQSAWNLKLKGPRMAISP